MMDIHPLKTEQDYDAALQAIEALWEAPRVRRRPIPLRY